MNRKPSFSARVKLAELSLYNWLRYNLPRIGVASLVLITLLFLLAVRWDLPGGTSNRILHLIGLVCSAIAPGYAVGLYVYYKDRYYQESMAVLARIFIFGVLTASLAGFGELILGSTIGYRESAAGIVDNFVYYFGVVALLEEGVKFLVVWRLAYHTGLFKQVYDGVLFCAASALGFATIENLLYVLTSGEDALMVAVLRSLTAVPSHIAFGVLMGYGMGRAKGEQGRHQEAEWLVLGFGGAVIFHGTYDFLLTMSGAAIPLFFCIMIGGWWVSYAVLRKGLTFSPFTHCSNCSTMLPQLASFCAVCREPHSVRLTCRNCGSSLDKWSRKCRNCSTRVRFPWHLRANRMRDLYPLAAYVPCPSCAEEIPEVGVFCFHCGNRRESPKAVE